jgi:hypothetical protein
MNKHTDRCIEEQYTEEARAMGRTVEEIKQMHNELRSMERQHALDRFKDGCLGTGFYLFVVVPILFGLLMLTVSIVRWAWSHPLF